MCVCVCVRACVCVCVRACVCVCVCSCSFSLEVESLENEVHFPDLVSELGSCVKVEVDV